MENKGVERRECQRFKIEGATVSYKKPKLLSTPKNYTEENCPVTEISRGGIRFLTEKPLKINQKVMLTVHLPGNRDPLDLQGRVIWKSVSPNQSYKYQLGIQFEPYGAKKNQNSPLILEKIKELEKKYQSQKSSG
ncbi:PilZ domain-containing protein [bacterium]|nr:PilZ domain-containing protein [bacterium]